MKKKFFKILSIEDDAFMKMFIKDVFWLYGIKEGYLFQSANNIKKGWNIVENLETRPDLILLDLVLPEVELGALQKDGGFQFLEKLRANPELKNIKVIIFSSYKDEELKERAKKLGVEDFLIKGERLPKELIVTVKKVLSNSNQ